MGNPEGDKSVKLLRRFPKGQLTFLCLLIIELGEILDQAKGLACKNSNNANNRLQAISKVGHD